MFRTGILTITMCALSISIGSAALASDGNYKRMISRAEILPCGAVEATTEAVFDGSEAAAAGDLIEKTIERAAVVRDFGAGAAAKGETKGPSLEAVPVRMDRLWTSFEERRMRLDRMISDNMMHGLLTADGAIKFRSDLDAIAADLYRFIASDTFSSERAVEVAARLDGVSIRLAQTLHAKPLPKLVVVDDSSGKTQLVADFFGDVITSRTLDSDLFKETLRERRSSLGALIAGGQSTGMIGAAETDKLRKELDGLAGLEKTLSETTKPNYAYLLQLAVHYDAIRERLAGLMDVYDMQPLVSNSTIMIKGKKVVHLDDSMLKRAGLEEQISSALANGALTGADGAHLRDMLNKLAIKEKSFRDDGVMNLDEAKEVKTGLNQVASQLTSKTL